MDWTSIIVAVIMAVGTLVGVIVTNRKSQTITEFKIAELTEEVHKHNKVIERTYQLETRADLADAEFKRVNHRLDDLEKRKKVS